MQDAHTHAHPTYPYVPRTKLFPTELELFLEVPTKMLN